MLDRYNYSERLSDIGSIYYQLEKLIVPYSIKSKVSIMVANMILIYIRTASLYAYKCKQYSKSNEFAEIRS